MDKIRTGDLKLIQELNRSIILNMIREHGPISRSEIAKRNKISPSTVASAVQELINEGFVREVGTGASSGGRKPIMVKFSPDNRFLIGVSISNSMISVAQINLEAKIHRKKELPHHMLHGETVINRTLDLIEQFLSECPDLDKCIGISVTVPGIVDATLGVIRYNPKLRLRNVYLTHIIESRFNIKTWLENDANAIVLAEKKFGKYSKHKNLFYIKIGDGVGAGIVYNDTILRGGRGGAGEFGHTSVDRSGIRCECGNIGCLENYVSWPAVYSRILSSITLGRTTSIMEMAHNDISQITPAVFKAALQNGDRLAKDIAEEVAAYLGAGVVNLVNLFNPEVIILGGNLVGDNELLMERVKAYVSQHAMSILADELVICTTSLGEDPELVGAASVLLQDVFRFSLSM